MSASLSIAFVGTGVMGRSMAGHLQKAGHRLHVHNRTKEKAQALLDGGAVWHDSAGAAAAEADVPVHFHKGVGPTPDTGPFGDRKGPGMVSAGQIQSDFMYAMPIADLIFGSVFDRHPTLKVVSGEGRIGWLAHFSERGDVSYRRHRFLQKLTLDLLPSEYLRRNVYNTFLEDRCGILMRELIGVDRQMWSSDYPHGDTTWPDSQALNEKQFEGVPANEVRQMLTLNAARLYRLPSDELKALA